MSPLPTGRRAAVRDALDRGLTALARFALRGFYRELDVTGRHHLPPRGEPTLVVANHFNALLDAVLVMHALGRLPRFVAKATLWRRVWARPFLWLAGMLPVHRREDGADPRRNHGVFRTCAAELARGGTVAVFPEGRLAPTPALQRVRTGAARIALNALAVGAEDLRIVPIGVVYEDKVALRSRALVRVGPPIEVDACALDGGEAEDPAAVRALTAEIARRLREVAPVFTDELDGAVLGRAADVLLRDPDGPLSGEVPLDEREAVARRLALAPPEVQAEVTAALARYELHLAIAGLRDVDVLRDVPPRRLARTLAGTVGRLLLTAPLALPGAVVNAVPYWGVHWSGRFVPTPALAASTRLLAGVALFPTAWLVTAWRAPVRTWRGRTAIVVASPVLGMVAMRSLEQAVDVARAWRGWSNRIERGEHLPRLRAERAALVAAISRAARAPDG